MQPPAVLLALLHSIREEISVYSLSNILHRNSCSKFEKKSWIDIQKMPSLLPISFFATPLCYMRS